MANPRASFTQADVIKLIKAYLGAGCPPPTIIIEPQRITAYPGGVEDKNGDFKNDWD